MSDKPVTDNKEYDVDSLWLSWCLTPDKMEIKYEDSNQVEYVVNSHWDNDSMLCGHQNLTMYLYAKDKKIKNQQAIIEKLESENKKLEEALSFYADKDSWDKYLSESYSKSCISSKDWDSKYLGNDGERDIYMNHLWAAKKQERL